MLVTHIVRTEIYCTTENSIQDEHSIVENKFISLFPDQLKYAQVVGGGGCSFL